MAQRIYTPAGDTIQRFHESNAFLRFLVGPVGGSKTSAALMEIMRRAVRQAPSPADGKRRTRWLITAGSYSKLKTTVVETWRFWTGGGGQLTLGDSPMRSVLTFDEVEVEVWFLPSSDADSMARLLSLELTGCVHCELTTTPETFFRMSTARVGRFPAISEGGPTWHGVICEGHAPEPSTYMSDLVYGAPSEGREVFLQPPALLRDSSGRFVENPLAENLANLPKNYYFQIARNNSPDFVKRFVENAQVWIAEGVAVYAGVFSDTQHVLPEEYEPSSSYPVTISCDPDLHGSAVLLQMVPGGRVIAFDELRANEVGLTALGQALVRRMRERYPECYVGPCWSDPAGAYRNNDLETACDLLEAATPWKWRPAPLPKNETSVRIEVVRHALKTLGDQGKPLLQISPRCAGLRRALGGGYRFRESKSAGSIIVSDLVVKDENATLAESLQYGLIGMQMHHEVTGRQRRAPGTSCAVCLRCHKSADLCTCESTSGYGW